MSARDLDGWYPERAELFERDHPDAPGIPEAEDDDSWSEAA